MTSHALSFPSSRSHCALFPIFALSSFSARPQLTFSQETFHSSTSASSSSPLVSSTSSSSLRESSRSFINAHLIAEFSPAAHFRY